MSKPKIRHLSAEVIPGWELQLQLTEGNASVTLNGANGQLYQEDWEPGDNPIAEAIRKLRAKMTADVQNVRDAHEAIQKLLT